MNGWNEGVWSYLENTWFGVEPSHSYNMGTLRQGGIFVPVIAIFEKGQGALVDCFYKLETPSAVPFPHSLS